MRVGSIAVVAGLVLCVSGLAVAQTEWVNEPDELLLGLGEPGAWDAGDRISLEVIRVDDTYHLFFNGKPEGAGYLREYDIGHATSADGIDWTLDPANPVLTRGAEDEWDDDALFGVAMVHDGPGFRMWYSGCDGEVCRAGLASSSDGTSWTKHADNPVIDVGEAGSFDASLVVPQSLVITDGLYRMWYTGTPGSPWVSGSTVDYAIGYAESEDGLSWTRYPTPVLEAASGWDSRWVTSASVLFDGLQHHMWYTGWLSGNSAIGYAVSTDGIEWTRYWGNPVMDEVGGVGSDYAQVRYNESTAEFEMWYTDAGDGIMRAISGCCSTAYGSTIPAAAYAAGAEGSFYETALELNNAGSSDAEFVFSWMPRDDDSSESMESDFFTLTAGRSIRYSNVLADVFDLEPDSFGALVIASSSPDLLAMARIANTPQEKVAGTFGQAIPALVDEDFTGEGERRRLLFGTEHDEMRFNVGCINADAEMAVVDFELFAADGTLLGTERLVLREQWSNDQLNRIFEAHQPVTGYVDFWSSISSGSIYCYGSVLDNVTSDPMTIPPM